MKMPVEPKKPMEGAKCENVGPKTNTLDERCDKPGLRGTGAARTKPTQYRDE
jgi:hypothetical protein